MHDVLTRMQYNRRASPDDRHRPDSILCFAQTEPAYSIPLLFSSIMSSSELMPAEPQPLYCTRSSILRTINQSLSSPVPVMRSPRAAIHCVFTRSKYTDEIIEREGKVREQIELMQRSALHRIKKKNKVHNTQGFTVRMCEKAKHAQPATSMYDGKKNERRIQSNNKQRRCVTVMMVITALTVKLFSPGRKRKYDGN
jgi:hypothetical protein